MKTILTCIALFCVLLMLIPSTGRPQSEQEGKLLLKKAMSIQKNARTEENLKAAVEKYLQALQVFEKVGSHKDIWFAASQLGIAYSRLEEYSKAQAAFEKGLEAAREIGSLGGEAAVLDRLGLLCKERRQARKAADHFEKALEIWQRVGLKKRAVLTLGMLAGVYSDLGQRDKTVKYYGKALSLAGELNDPPLVGMVLNDLGGAYRDWGQYDKALPYFEKSLEIRKKLKDQASGRSTLDNIGLIYSYWGQYDKALPYFEESLEIQRTLKDRKGEARAFGNLGTLYDSWDRYEKAIEYHEESLKLALQERDQTIARNAFNNLGSVYFNSGRYEKAVDYFEKSLAMSREMGDRHGEAVALSNRASVYLSWGQYEKAISWYERFVTSIGQEGNTSSTGIALHHLETVYNNLARAYMALGQYEKAAPYFEKSLSICREIKDRHAEGSTLNNLGALYAHHGRRDAAEKTLKKAIAVLKGINVSTKRSENLLADLYLDEGNMSRAVTLIEKSGDYLSKGRLALIQSDYAQAKVNYERILELAERNRDAENLIAAHTALGLVNEGLKDDLQAEKHYRNAVELTEEIRSSLSPKQREKFFDVRINGFYRTAPYEGLARVLMRQKSLPEALKNSEYTKARLFAESMSRYGQGTTFDVPPEILMQDREITDQLAALKKNLRKAFGKKNKLTIKVLEPQVKDLEKRFVAHRNMLREKYPLYAATKYPEPMDLSQAALKEDEWVLSYDVTDTGLLIYLTHRKKVVNALFKPIPRKELDELVSMFRKSVSRVGESENPIEALKKFDFRSGKKLSDILLADILSELPKGTPLIVIPDDSLGVLPFEMLLLSDSGKIATDKDFPYVSGAEFFGDRNPISYYQSITALTLARLYAKKAEKAKKTLAMCDPVFGTDDPRIAKAQESAKIAMQPLVKEKLTSMSAEMGIPLDRLPQTTELGEFLKKLQPESTDVFFGLDVTKARLFKLPLEQYRSIVFATHGAIENEVPGIMEPVLFLTIPGQPEDKDGFLRLSEVMGLKLNADVVALTACQTGLGRRISGEGVMGMGRAFQYAGAKSALMSLWKVAAEPSVMMMKSFFTHLKEGKSKLDALNLARQEIRQAGYDHPVFWAGFILAGEVN